MPAVSTLGFDKNLDASLGQACLLVHCTQQKLQYAHAKAATTCSFGQKAQPQSLHLRLSNLPQPAQHPPRTLTVPLIDIAPEHIDSAGDNSSVVEVPRDEYRVGHEVERRDEVGEGGEERGLDGGRRRRVARAEVHRPRALEEGEFAEESAHLPREAPLDGRLVLDVGADEGALVGGHRACSRGLGLFHVLWRRLHGGEAGVDSSSLERS